MNISPDGVTVRFKTEPESLFEVEKSDAKPNTVRILDAYEADQIKRKHPTKIIIQYQREIFLRTITNIHLTPYFFGKVIAIFSWTNEEHHHTPPIAIERDPYAHTMSINEGIEPSIAEGLDRELQVTLDNLRGKLSLNELIRKMLDCYLAPHQHTMPEDWYSEDPFVAKTAPTTEEPLLDAGFVAIEISKQMFNTLQNSFSGRTMNSVVQELYETYLYKLAEERGPLHDQ